MKKKKIIIALLSGILVIAICIGSISIVISSKSPYKEINRCKKYVDKYIDEDDVSACLPTDKATQDEIELYTTEIIALGSLEEYMYKTNYFGRYIFEKTHAKLVYSSDVGLKASYFYEIVILKLKVLLAQGRAEEFEELFSEYCYAMDACFFTGAFYSYFIYDENYPIEYNNERYTIMENALWRVYEESSDVQKFFLLDLILNFYHYSDDYSEKKELYEDLRSELGSLLSDDEIEQERIRRSSLEYVIS